MKTVLTLSVLTATALTIVTGGHLILRPVPATEVRRFLKLAGREDAIPEGRVISQGLAAVKGFTLGFKKGALGVAIADGLIAAAGNVAGGIDTNNASVGVNVPSFNFNSTSNQLCFTSRSAVSDIVASDEGRQAGTAIATATATATAGTAPTGTSTAQTSPSTSNTATNVNTGTGTGTNSVTGTATTTQTGGGTVNCIVLNKT